VPIKTRRKWKLAYAVQKVWGGNSEAEQEPKHKEHGNIKYKTTMTITMIGRQNRTGYGITQGQGEGACPGRDTW
jgi:hypothetical protein